MNVNSIGVLHKPQTFCGSGNTHPTVSTKMTTQVGNEFATVAKSAKPMSAIRRMAYKAMLGLSILGIGAGTVGCSSKDEPNLPTKPTTPTTPTTPTVPVDPNAPANPRNYTVPEETFSSFSEDLMGVKVPDGSIPDSLCLQDDLSKTKVGLKYDSGLSNSQQMIFRTTSYDSKGVPVSYGFNMFSADPNNVLVSKKYLSDTNTYNDVKSRLCQTSYFAKENGKSAETVNNIKYFLYKYQGQAKTFAECLTDAKQSGTLSNLFASFKRIK